MTHSAPSGLSESLLSLTRSQELLTKARELIPGVTQSMMKRPDAFAPGAYPAYLASGDGALVRDVDGNEYIDYVCGLGANALGHNHPAIVDAIRGALSGGLSHSLPTELEVQTAERLAELIPGADMVRFFKTGADATTAAVRLARHVTGKEGIVTVGYNGFHDHFMFDTPGVPAALRALTTRLPLFRPEDEPALLEQIRKHASQLAAIVLSLPYNRCVDAAFLKELRAVCTQSSVLLVLDEIVTGFRLALGGAQQHFDVAADIVCLSKALAAGMPLSAVTGPRAIMERMAELQVSTTFGGERLSLAACHAALGVYRDTDAITRAQQLGERLRDGVNRVAQAEGASLRVSGYPAIPCFMLSPDPVKHASLAGSFLAGMAKRGVLLRRDVSFVSCAHTEAQVDRTIDAVRATLKAMGDGAQAEPSLRERESA